MTSMCSICELPCDEVGGKFFNCDSCQRPNHVECTELTASEVRCLELKKRSLKFFCTDCEEGLKILPQVLSKLSILTEQVNKINEFIEKNKSASPLGLSEQSKIIEEISERNNRKNNIIIYNINESESKSYDVRREFEEKAIYETLNAICDVDKRAVVKYFRMGKIKNGNDKPRPIKVVLNSSSIVLNILKGKHKCKSPINISDDKTLMQRSELKALRTELDALNRDGKIKTIKYINGQPRIVDIGPNSKNGAVGSA